MDAGTAAGASLVAPVSPLSAASVDYAAQIVHRALARSCQGDYSRLMGRCVEAQMVGYHALAQAGIGAYMVCGYYHGQMDEAATELFGGPGCGHSWIELSDGTVVDPTAWVFQLLGQEPRVDTMSEQQAAERGYEPGAKSRTWRADYPEHLARFGLSLS